MNGGNILVFKEMLGHSDIKMTMIYAHFAPTHLEDAVTKNPFYGLKNEKLSYSFNISSIYLCHLFIY